MGKDWNSANSLFTFSVCCHPEILLPWPRDVTTSSLYTRSYSQANADVFPVFASPNRKVTFRVKTLAVRSQDVLICGTNIRFEKIQFYYVGPNTKHFQILCAWSFFLKRVAKWLSCLKQRQAFEGLSGTPLTPTQSSNNWPPPPPPPPCHLSGKHASFHVNSTSTYVESFKSGIQFCQHWVIIGSNKHSFCAQVFDSFLCAIKNVFLWWETKIPCDCSVTWVSQTLRRRHVMGYTLCVVTSIFLTKKRMKQETFCLQFLRFTPY